MRINGVITRNYNALVAPTHDRLSINGVALTFKNFTYIALNKPPGVITSCTDEKNRRCVLDLLPANLRYLRPVGRLDMNSAGLLIMTNDGQLTQRLTHPALHELKSYEVTVSGYVDDKSLDRLRRGINLPDGKTLPAEVSVIERFEVQTVLKIGLREGRNRQIRRMCEVLGHRVRCLMRTSVGALELGKLKPGAWRYLSDQEIRKLGVRL